MKEKYIIHIDTIKTPREAVWPKHWNREKLAKQKLPTGALDTQT